MPIYEYSCPKCSHQFDVLISNDKDIPAKCPKCAKGKPAKMFSAFAVSSSQAPSAMDAACPTCPSAGTGCGRSCAQGM